jgi:hypothetical protein
MNVIYSNKTTFNSSKREIAKSPAQWWRSVVKKRDHKRFIDQIRNHYLIEVGHPEEIEDDEMIEIKSDIESYLESRKPTLTLLLGDLGTDEFTRIWESIKPELVEGFKHYILLGKYPQTIPNGINGGVNVIEVESLDGQVIPMVQLLLSPTSDTDALLGEARSVAQETFGSAKGGRKISSEIGLWWEGLPIEEQIQPNKDLAYQYLKEHPEATLNYLPSGAEVTRYAARLKKYRARITRSEYSG